MSFDTAIIAERKIKEAIDEGKFDSLPGMGQPIDLNDDPTTPAHLRLANHVLKNAGVLPEWMQADSEIDAAREECVRLWREAEKEYARRRGRVDTAGERGRAAEGARFADWHARERARYLRAVKTVNTEILKLNYAGPRAQRVHFPLNIGEETARFDAAFPAHPDYTAAADAEPDDGSRRLRDAAASIYRYDNGKVR